MKAIMLGVIAFIFFAGAAGLSWFLWSEPPADESVAAVNDEATAEPSGNAPDDQVVGIHSRPASAEQLFRMGVLLREQQQGLIRQREGLQEQERRLKLVYQDIDNHQRQLDGIYAELRDKVATGETLLDKLRGERQMLEKIRSEAEAAKQQAQDPNMDETARANTKKIAGWFEEMETPAAAKIIQDMANDGQTDFAVQLLSQVDDRQASGILSAINDEQLVQDLLKKMRQMVRTAKKPRR